MEVPKRRPTVVGALVFLIIFSAPPTLAAQRWEDELVTLGVNAVLGGFSGGVAQRMGEGSFRLGFGRGVVGGSLIYAGKRIATKDFPAAGLLGREVAAVGGSVVNNAIHQRGMFDRVILPVGLVRLYIEPSVATPVRAKLDLATVVVLGYTLSQPDADYDPTASLLAGVPVFTASQLYGNPDLGGRHVAGVVVIHDRYPHWVAKRVLAHELVHLIQYDAGVAAFGEPAEGWLLKEIPRGAWLHRHVDLGFSLLPWAGLNALVEYDARPWEREAGFLSGFRGEGAH